jgi:hypothetical protein
MTSNARPAGFVPAAALLRRLTVHWLGVAQPMKRNTRPKIRPRPGQPANVDLEREVQLLFFAEELTDELAAEDPVVALILANIRSTPIPLEPL